VKQRQSLTRYPMGLALLLACATLSSANAMTLREMHALEKSDRNGRNYVQYFLVGVMEGMLEAQSRAVRGGGNPLLCINGRRLEPSMALSLFETELKRGAGVYEADMPVQMVLANALTTVYAC
jgi:hypothetical protein